MSFTQPLLHNIYNNSGAMNLGQSFQCTSQMFLWLEKFMNWLLMCPVLSRNIKQLAYSVKRRGKVSTMLLTWKVLSLWVFGLLLRLLIERHETRAQAGRSLLVQRPRKCREWARAPHNKSGLFWKIILAPYMGHSFELFRSFFCISS